MALELTINDNNYVLPSEWAEVTLRQFIDILILKEDKLNSDLDIFIKTLNILSDNKQLEEEILNLDTDSFKIIREGFIWLSVEPPISKNLNKSFFEFEGKKFTLKKDFNKLTVGESITIEMLLKDNKIDLNPLEIAFSVLFREIDENGNIKEFDPDDMVKILEYSKFIKLLDVYEVINFFLSGDKSSSSKNSKVSLSLQKKI